MKVELVMNILVVDDDNLTRKMFSDLLAKEGHETTTVESGHEALDKMQTSIYDFAIVDLKMPGLSGIDVLKAIKLQNPSTDVIIVTAYGTVDTAVEALKEGAIDFIEKPFKIKKIKEIIKKLNTKNRIGVDYKQLLEKSYKSIVKKSAYIDAIKNNPGLYLTIQNSDTIRRKYGLKNMSIIEVTSRKEGEELGTKDLREISNQINEYLQTYTETLVVLDGFEFFIKYFPRNLIKDFLLDVHNDLLKNKSEMVIYVNSSKLGKKDLENFTRLLHDIYLNLGFDSLSNSMEIEIIEHLKNNSYSSFNSILKNVSTKQSPKLSFHLQKLIDSRIIKKDNGKYSLELKGEIIVRIYNQFKQMNLEDYRNPISLIYEKSK